MTRRKRRPVEDPDCFDSRDEGNRKYIKAEFEEDAPRDPDSTFPTVILSGFTWNMDVDARIARALEIYNPLFFEVSLELAAHEKLAIKNQYGIETDFMRVVCGSAIDQERMVNELDHARFTWTTPYLEVRKVNDVGHGNGSRVSRQHPHDNGMSTTAPMLNPEYERRQAQAKVWIKLSEAISNARTHLFGDDLDTFEALIAQPVPGVDPMERVNRWIRGGLSDSRPQRINMGVQRVKVEGAQEADEVQEDIGEDDEMAGIVAQGPKPMHMPKNDEDKENVTMDDEMAGMGMPFGRTGLTPWW